MENIKKSQKTLKQSENQPYNNCNLKTINVKNQTINTNELINIKDLTIDVVNSLTRDQLIHNTSYGSIMAYANFPSTIKEALVIIHMDAELKNEVKEFFSGWKKEDIFFSDLPNQDNDVINRIVELALEPVTPMW